MSLYTAAEIKADIVSLKVSIGMAERTQEYSAGAQMGLKRGALEAMYQRLKRLEDLYNQVAAQEQAAGNTALVQFEGVS